jgi:hypothetical protein
MLQGTRKLLKEQPAQVGGLETRKIQPPVKFVFLTSPLSNIGVSTVAHDFRHRERFDDSFATSKLDAPVATYQNERC